MENLILEKAKYWATSSVFDIETQKEIGQLIEAGDEKELSERFYQNLQLGTGGLRGILGAGSARMNIYNIRKATHAFALQLLESFPNQKVKIAVSYDSRRFSREFAETVCEVMAGHNIYSYITEELRPTPMLSFAVRHYGCKGGVCVTASHNPPNYNGYKMYWETGAQITPPFDGYIVEKFNKIEKYEEIPSVSFAEGVKEGLITEIGSDFDEIYFKKIEELKLRDVDTNDFKVVYTPLHGTGAFPVKEALKRFGFNDVTIVPEQEKPDSNFSTVKFPNPEEPEAMQMALDLGKKLGADIVLGTDPDTDRIGMIVKEGESYTFLNGNQLGTILIEYMLSSLKEKGELGENPLVIKTIVTTDLQDDVAKYHGAHCEETLTGFKWICDLIEKYEIGEKKPYRNYICGGEESYGFLAGSFVRDKDAVSACAIACEMIAYYKSKNLTASEVLDSIYRRHGLYLESLYTITLPGMEGGMKIKAMMDSFRANPPKQLAGIRVEMIKDIQKSQITKLHENDSELVGTIDLPASNVLQFILEDGTKVSARPSGTEPKIKFYFSVKKNISPDISDADLALKKDEAAQQISDLEKAFTDLAQGS